MFNETSPDIIKIIKLAIRYKYLIIGMTIAGAAAGFLYTLASPKIFKAEAIISIPETYLHPVTIDSRGNVNALINIYETRYLIKKYWEKLIKEGHDSLMNKEIYENITYIGIEDIRGSNVQFNLIVYSKKRGEFAIDAMGIIYNFIRQNDYVLKKYNEEKKIIDSLLTEIKLSITKAIEIKEKKKYILNSGGVIAFNPVEMETRIIELKEKYFHYVNISRAMHNYEYVRGPNLSENPNKKRYLVVVLFSSLIGLILGILCIYFWNSFIKLG